MSRLIQLLVNIEINRYDAATIIWNIFLAIIPFLICRFLIELRFKTNFKKAGKIILSSMLFLIWLLFIPNTAYLITDVRHMMDYCPINTYRVCIENSWMIMFFFTYSAIGWVLLVYAFNQMRYFLCLNGLIRFDKIFYITIIPLVSLGVMLGLINRNNSWGIAASPLKIFEDLSVYFTDSVFFKNWLIFTGFYFVLLFAGHFLFIRKRGLKFRKFFG